MCLRRFFSHLGYFMMKYVLFIVAVISFGGLAGCQPGVSGNAVISDMGGSNGSGGSGY